MFFHGSNVIAAGDVFAVRYPSYDFAGGGTIDGSIAGLNRIIALIDSNKKTGSRTYIVPGHGRICDEPDIVKYRDMTVLFRDRIRDMIKKGMTLEQVKAAKPFADYEALYHSAAGFGSADTVIETIYNDLKQKK